MPASIIKSCKSPIRTEIFKILFPTVLGTIYKECDILIHFWSLCPFLQPFWQPSWILSINMHLSHQKLSNAFFDTDSKEWVWKVLILHHVLCHRHWTFTIVNINVDKILTVFIPFHSLIFHISIYLWVRNYLSGDQ